MNKCNCCDITSVYSLNSQQLPGHFSYSLGTRPTLPWCHLPSPWHLTIAGYLLFSTFVLDFCGTQTQLYPFYLHQTCEITDSLFCAVSNQRLARDLGTELQIGLNWHSPSIKTQPNTASLVPFPKWNGMGKGKKGGVAGAFYHLEQHNRQRGQPRSWQGSKKTNVHGKFVQAILTRTRPVHIARGFEVFNRTP